MSNIFGLLTASDTRSALEGAYVPDMGGEVCFIDRIYQPRDNNSIEGMKVVYHDNNGGHEDDFDFAMFNWAAQPTLGLTHAGRDTPYMVHMDSQRQWKKVVHHNRTTLSRIAPARPDVQRGLNMELARFMFSPSYRGVGDARTYLRSSGRRYALLSKDLYMYRHEQQFFLGYHTRLIGQLRESDDGDMTAHLHPAANALLDIVKDYFTVGAKV